MTLSINDTIQDMKHPTLRPAIIWETHEYYFREKTSDWYWAVGIIAVSIAIVSILFGNILFALLVLIGSCTLSLVAAKRPTILRVEINNTGAIIERTLYPYISLHSFWVENNDHLGMQSKLILKSRKIATQLLVLPLEGVDPETLRDFLLDHLPEMEHTESISLKLLEFLGF